MVNEEVRSRDESMHHGIVFNEVNKCHIFTVTERFPSVYIMSVSEEERAVSGFPFDMLSISTKPSTSEISSIWLKSPKTCSTWQQSYCSTALADLERNCWSLFLISYDSLGYFNL